MRRGFYRRAITAIENHESSSESLLEEIFPFTGRSFVLGITGAPGTGKTSSIRALAAGMGWPCETVIAAIQRDKTELAKESADVLYHLLVLWAASGVTPQDVYAVLQAREGQSLLFAA